MDDKTGHVWKFFNHLVTVIFDPDRVIKWNDELTKKFEIKLLSDSFFTKSDTNAGFVTRINQRALDLLADYLKERVNRFMHHGEIIFNFSAPLTNEVSVKLSLFISIKFYISLLIIWSFQFPELYFEFPKLQDVIFESSYDYICEFIWFSVIFINWTLMHYSLITCV